MYAVMYASLRARSRQSFRVAILERLQRALPWCGQKLRRCSQMGQAVGHFKYHRSYEASALSRKTAGRRLKEQRGSAAIRIHAAALQRPVCTSNCTGRAPASVAHCVAAA